MRFFTWGLRTLCQQSNVKSQHLCRFSKNNICFMKAQLNRVQSVSISRHCSTSVNSIEETVKSENENQKYRLVYEGPLSKKIRLLKMFSLSTATLSVVCAPTFLFFGKESIPFVGKAIMSSSILIMGLTTTYVMHWLTRVYVHKMYFDADTQGFLAETVSIFGTYKKHYFHAGEVCIPEIESAFSTFEAKGNKYFIHVDLKEAEQIMKYIKEYNYENL